MEYPEKEIIIMEDLEKKCEWKNIVTERKVNNPNYHPLGSPLFFCLYSCTGKNKDCGGYYEKKS